VGKRQRKRLYRPPSVTLTTRVARAPTATALAARLSAARKAAVHDPAEEAWNATANAARIAFLPRSARVRRAIDHLDPRLALDYALEEAPAAPWRYMFASIFAVPLGFLQLLAYFDTRYVIPLVGAVICLLVGFWCAVQAIDSGRYPRLVLRAARRVVGLRSSRPSDAALLQEAALLLVEKYHMHECANEIMGTVSRTEQEGRLSPGGVGARPARTRG
jgi:hypothetical protein